MTVKSLMIKVGVDLSEFTAGMDRMTAGLDKNKKTFTDIGLGMTAVGGILTAFFGKAVSEASDAQAAHEKLVNSLKAEGEGAVVAADRLSKYAEGLQLTTGIEDEEIQSAQALLGTMGLNEKQITALTPRILDMAVAHRDASGGAIDLEGAARSVGKAVLGQATALQRQGIAISENTKLTGDFNSILHDLDKSVGGAAEAFGNTFAGKMKIAKVRVSEVFETIGSFLLPVLTTIVQVVGGVVKSVQTWIDNNKSLVQILVPVAAAIGGVLLVTGPLVAVFPKIVAGAAAAGKAFLALATNPMVLLAAAAAGLVVLLLKVRDAEEELAKASGRLDAKEKVTRDRLMAAADAAGVSRKEMVGLIEKYHGYIGALEVAITKGKEGEALQKGLYDTTRKSAGAYDEYEKSLKKTSMTSQELTAAQQELQDKILKMRETLTADFMKLTLTEVQQGKWAAEQEYQDRIKELGKLKAANANYSKDVEMAAKIRNAKIFEIEFQASIKLLQHEQKIRDEKKKAAAAELQTILAAMTQEREKRTAFAAARLELDGKTFAAQLVLLKAERDAKLQSLMITGKDLTDQQKKEIAEWDQYYKNKAALIEEDRKAAEEGFNAIMVGGTESIKTLTENTMTAFVAWGDGTKSLLTVVGDAFKGMADMATQAVSRAVSTYIAGSKKEQEASEATALGGVIAWCMKALGPIFGLVAVTAGMALVHTLFSAIHFAEGGIVTKPTLALIGEAGPEAVIPLRGAGRGGPVPTLADIGGGVRITANFYGDIRSDKDIDRMSKAMADQVSKAMRHRRV